MGNMWCSRNAGVRNSCLEEMETPRHKSINLRTCGGEASSTRHSRVRARTESEPWGWFAEGDDINSSFTPTSNKQCKGMLSCNLSRSDSTVVLGPSPPEYILHASPSSQKLWKETASFRPKQPAEERDYYEKLWSQNFINSGVSYDSQPKLEEATVGSPTKKSICFEGINSFCTAASKTYECDSCTSTITYVVALPKYRVIRNTTTDRTHAEFLVVVYGGHETVAVWRRYSQFKKIADSIVAKGKNMMYCKSLDAWREVQKQQRVYRCVDPDYIQTKCRFLEDFIRQFVFESPDPHLLGLFLSI